MLEVSGTQQANANSADWNLPQELIPFVKKAPLSVVVRSTLEWLIQPSVLDELFGTTAQKQYQRKLTLSFFVQTMLDVACGIHPCPTAAYKAHRVDPDDATKQAFFAKLTRMEVGVSAAVAHQIADSAAQVIAHLGATWPEPIPGYRARIVDGTQLGGRTDHRIKPLRHTKSAGLTGKALAVYAPAEQLIRQVVLHPDAYAQERSMLKQLQLDQQELWIADSAYCVRGFLFNLHRAHSVFVIRWHPSSCPYEEIDKLRHVKGTKHGIKEHKVWLEDPETQERLQARRIVKKLGKPTRNGNSELVLITNVPDMFDAERLCDVYAERWQIEVCFNRLTEQLQCEPSGLDHPAAALFAFAMAVCAANALAIVQAALKAEHGAEPVQELSYYYMVEHIAQMWHGMELMVPTERWEFVRNMPVQTLSDWLRYITQGVPMDRFRRSRRAPKKPPPKKGAGKQHKHVSVQRLLNQTQ